MTGEARHPDGDAGPLDGLTVLDASRVLAGPFCAMQLGDLGADVIKVERPGVGDDTRAWTPPTYGDSGEAAYYLAANRNKRSIALDLATEAGRDVFRDLAREADVLVENFRVGKLAEWGLDYPDLREENSDLVYCSISGYGEWGPDRDRPGYDLVLQAEAGFMSFTGVEDGPPVRVGVAITDLAAGLYATQAVLAALLERELADAGGQKIDVSLIDAATALTTYMATGYFATGESPGRMGSRHPNIAPYQAFETADDHVVVGVASRHLWPAFCRAIGRPDLIDDERFETNADRVANVDALETEIEAAFADRTAEEAVELLREAGVPASRINDMESVFSHPQVLARGMRQSLPHPTAGTVDLPGVPLHFSRTPASGRRHPPLLGEHTDEVLAELGYGEERVARLRADDVVA